MIWLSVSALVWAALAFAPSSGAADGGGHRGNTYAGPNNYIIECHNGRDKDVLIHRIKHRDGQVHHDFNSGIFYGVSASVPGLGGDEIRNMAGVKDVWPVQVFRHEAKENSLKPRAAPKRQPYRRAVDTSWNHAMTQVDMLHSEGFYGTNITIAIIDSGTGRQVNYTHPALGGCFGRGCRVARGANFVRNEGKYGDPMDQNGHGTAVAGVLAGNDPRRNFVGVAPGATLAAYRVVDSKGYAREDDLIAGWLKAVEDGAQIIASSAGFDGSGWAQCPMAAVVARIAASGIPCIVGNGNDSKKGLFFSLDPSTGRNVLAVNSFAHRMVSSAGGSRAVTAGMSWLSASGPTWELDIKPNVGVPGDEIPCPQIDGSYDNCSGTSFAGPQVAGMAALIAERREDFDPGHLMSLLMTTAAVQKDGHFIPVVHLAFNDTDHRAQSITIRVTNKARFEVTYQLSILPAVTIYARRLPRDFKNPEYIQAPASIDMSKTFLKLVANQSDTITISAKDPKGLEADRLPVWSGWVAINSSDGKTLTVPYMGLAGSLHKQQVLESDGVSLQGFNHDMHNADSNRGAKFSYTVKKGFTTLSASIIINLILGSRVYVEAVPLSPRKWMTDRLGKSRGFPIKGYSPRALQRYTGIGLYDKEWDGQIQSGDYLPPGDYQLVVRALRVFGDPTMEADWDAAEPLPFQVMSGAGQEACKAYQSGKGPKDALFRNLQECHQVHNKTAVDAPWIPRPQDSSKCDDDNPTEEDCGTYHYCKAHQERLDDIISPFRNKYEFGV
ncbi:Subtilisin E [Metarhizium brunneum]|uniref:Subtilisin E n=1 Tax=Metarhizium brunneum TaxID=500148 RepID=A0A7D5V4M5_9HYPO|nr:Subtilisin E [Metarhizium brunneum]